MKAKYQLDHYPEYKQFLIEVCRIYGYDEMMVHVLAEDSTWYYYFDERMSPQEATEEFDAGIERELEKIGFKFVSSATPSGNDDGKDS